MPIIHSKIEDMSKTIGTNPVEDECHVFAPLQFNFTAGALRYRNDQPRNIEPCLIHPSKLGSGSRVTSEHTGTIYIEPHGWDGSDYFDPIRFRSSLI